MNIRRWQIPTTLVFLILGIIISTQFKAQQIKYTEERKETSRSYERINAMEKILTIRNNRQREYQNELEALKGKIELYEKLAKDKHEVGAGISEEIDKYRLLTGTTKVSGSGIIITIDEPKDKNTQMTTLSISQDDLVDLIDILRYAGAEAISINGQRIVNYTSVFQGGENLLINNVPVYKSSSPNYEIAAIGPKSLAQMVSITSNLVEDLKEMGFKVKVNEQSNLIIPAYTGRTFKYAKPIKQ